MSKGVFFISWQLWQEMTFVLAMGIVVVFFVGLIKLWVSNRHMQRLEELDAERQTRMAQIRKSGLSRNGKHRLGNEIPFGVKALERNVEVDGIWVARMVSMASRPPERKWSSMRKVRSPSAASLLVKINDPSDSNQMSQRGSRRHSKLSRSETVVPSLQVRKKLGDVSLLEDEREARDLVARDMYSSQAGDEQARKPQPGYGGALSKIQRGLKRMTSTEAWQAGERKKIRPNQAFGAKEFREGAQARRPQRFYPPITTTAATPLVEPQGNKDKHEGPRYLVKKQSTTRQQHRDQTRSSSQGSQSTAKASSKTSVEGTGKRTGPPRIPARASSESARTSVSIREEGVYRQPRRISRESQHDAGAVSSMGSNRRRSSDGQQDVATAHGLPRSTGSMHRYPPNSSRSGGTNPHRSRSLN